MENLGKFGIVAADEAAHPFDPAVEWWNESWFWDWFDADGRLAGHCRIGIHPNQQRLWVWFYLHRDGEWIAVEEPRLPLSDFDPARLACDRWGLRFSWDVHEPLRAGRLRFEGFGRVLSGARTGWVLPVGADLEVRALGPPHSMGRAAAAGHRSEKYPASRFEQPIAARGTLAIAGESLPFEGRGERDHSWGPRHWNLEWTFLVLNGEELRLQCAEARIPNVGRHPAGYVLRDEMRSIQEVKFDLEFRDDEMLRPVSGRFEVTVEDGSVEGGAIESLSGAEIDITHTFVPPRRSIYRRALVRVHLDGGAAPLLGWMESNRFPDEG